MKDIIKDRIEKIENNIVPQGYKKTEIGIIPEDWEVFNFKDIFKVSQGLQIPIKERLNKKEKNCYIYITNEYINNKNNIRHAKEYVKNPKKNVIANKKDILMTRTGNTGIVVTNEEGVFHNNFFKINYNESDFSKDFLIYTLRGDYIQYNIRNLAGTSTIPDLTHSDFYSLNGMFPPLKEQEKIASILSTWDQYIEDIDSIIESKKNQKKGLMQNLLTGEVRLPGFKGEWKEVKLGDVTKIVTGTTPSTKQSNYFGGDYPWITPTDITDLKYIYDSERKLSTKGIEKGRFIPKDSLLITCIASIGKNSILKVDGSCNQQINALYPSKKHSNEFFYYLLTYKKKYMESFAGKTATKILNKKSFESLKFLIPIFDEQVAIASVLSSADREIELLEDLRNKRMEEKKGLMQLLLTGIVRVGG